MNAMSEADELKAAQRAVDAGARDEALPVLWKLFASKNGGTRLGAGLILLVALDPLTQNERLLQVTDATIDLASAMRKNDMVAFLLGKKAEFLYSRIMHG